ncbi:hypothetical protein [Nonomuraea sp. NPDC049709]|uniref:hypothetical protein n=1 Tax=Nonomuraea sp. NPDC049709 TaxID=3154736 RepID=UPI00341BF224
MNRARLGRRRRHRLRHRRRRKGGGGTSPPAPTPTCSGRCAGGGDFAVVTALELTLPPAPRLFGGRILWAGEHAAEVMDAYRQITAAAPEELTVWLDLLHFPGSAPMVAVDATYLGDEDEARGRAWHAANC